MKQFVIWWMKRDLRIEDNAALRAALDTSAQLSCPLVALWICEPKSYSSNEFHPRRDKFISESLEDLNARLENLGVLHCIAEGTAEDVFQRLIAQGLTHVFSHQETGLLWTFERDLALKNILQSSGVAWTECPTNGVVRGLKDRDRWQGIYQSRMKKPIIQGPLQPLSQPSFSDSFIKSSEVQTLRLFDWTLRHESTLFKSALRAPRVQQKGGESIAKGLLSRFLAPDVHSKYLLAISKPQDAQYFSSRLSPYLAFGCISSRQILASISTKNGTLNTRSISAFKSRLAWRDHFIQKLENFPAMEEREQNAALANLRPEMSREEMERWENGQTGFPLVDACLRSVHQTGFLNFRMRAMLMSFATHLMWRDWRAPAWDLARAFLDFEPGIHFAQVHMQAAVTGNNQIRIYNPMKQSAENDPEARFIRHWVPELKDVDTHRIHHASALHAKYPTPMFDLSTAMAFARQELFARFKDQRVRAEAKLVQEKLGSRGGRLSWRGRDKILKEKTQTRMKAKPKTLFDED